MLLALIVNDALEFWHLLVGAGVMGCVFPFIMPARQAIVFNVVGREGMPNAVALNMAGMNTTRVLGPAAAGFLLGCAGPAELTYAIGMIALRRPASSACCRSTSRIPAPEARERPIWQKREAKAHGLRRRTTG